MHGLLLCLAGGVLYAQPQPAELLARVSEEAEVFRQMAPKALAQETLHQRALRAVPRFRPRTGTPAAAAGPVFVTREVVSEYSVGNIAESGSENLYEFRQVVSVDGRRIQTPEKARHSLSLDLKHPDEQVRKRMLQDFEKHGIPDASVTDFGTVLLLFCKRMLPQLKVASAGEGRVGPDAVWLLSFQSDPDAARLVEFRGRRTVRKALKGTLAVRKSDHLPVRITLTDSRVQDRHQWTDEAVVEYVQSQHGFLTPVSVSHRRVLDGQLVVENRFRYAPFKLFGASAEIKFSEVPTPPKP